MARFICFEDGQILFSVSGAGGKGGGSAPPAPDPAATAAAQGQANRESAVATARLNRIDTISPLGSRIFTEELLPGQEDLGPKEQLFKGTETITLNPTAQAAFDEEQQLRLGLNQLANVQTGRVSEATGQPFDTANLPERVSSIDRGALPALPGVEDFGAERGRVSDAVYRRATSRLDPQFEQAQSDLEAQLANQGITQQTAPEAYERAISNFQRGRTDAYQTALDQSELLGGQEQSRLFGLGSSARSQDINERLALANLSNQGRGADIQERAFLRNIPINDVAALTGTGPGIQLPQFSQPGQVGVQAPDIIGATNAGYANQLNAFNANQQNQQNFLSNIFGLGGALGGAYLLGR